MTREILEMNIERGRRVIAVSDVHGHPELLDRLLEKVNCTPRDLLVLAGDMIDCGARSLTALRRAMALAKGSAVALAGNWEATTLRLIESDTDNGMAEARGRWLYLSKVYGSCLFADMLSELGMEFDERTDMRAALSAVGENYLDELEFMRRMPAALDTGEFFFAHASIPTLDIGALKNADDMELLKCDAFMEKGLTFDRWVVVGHWPVSLYSPQAPCLNPVIDARAHIISIDGGVGKKPDCQLNALLLRAGEPENVEFDCVESFPKARALDAQEGFFGGLCVNWFNRRAELVSEDGGFARVRHIDSGAVIDVPKRWLYKNPEGELCCDDITYNRLSVEAGDEISVIERMPSGIYGKNKGRVGWYYGRVTEDLI